MKADIEKIITTQIKKQQLIEAIGNKLDEIEMKIISINEDSSMVTQNNGQQADEVKGNLLNDTKVGQMIILKMQGNISIKIQRVFNELFKVLDSTDSAHLNDGDYLILKGDTSLFQGQKLNFTILRAAIQYNTQALTGWDIIKN